MEFQREHHIAMLPSPGMGHLIPFVELAKLLVFHHRFSVTLLIPCIGVPPRAQTEFLQTLPENIHYIMLPPVDFSNVPLENTPESKICLAVSWSLDYVRESLGSLSRTTKLVALITDAFAIDAFGVACEFDVPPYLYCPIAAMNVHFLLHVPKLDDEVTCEFRDMQAPIYLPGCVPLYGRDFVEPAQDRSSQAYKWILHTSKAARLAKGILVNSFLELEPNAIRALEGDDLGYPTTYTIGPLIQAPTSRETTDSYECLKWLDDQPSGSVLFVSFGSGGTLSYVQLTELAIGLEISGQRFLWVVRSPNENSSSGSYFSAQSHKDPFGFLPNGFVDRTKGRGLLVPSWAPQMQVLSHKSTGGFLTHCGWNSTLESLVNGVPLIAWPLYAEQKTNAVLLAEGIKVAIRPKSNENGIIERGEISRVVKNLMGAEGKGIRNRAKELQEAAKLALSEDGTSTRSLSRVAHIWRQ